MVVRIIALLLCSAGGLANVVSGREPVEPHELPDPQQSVRTAELQSRLHRWRGASVRTQSPSPRASVLESAYWGELVPAPDPDAPIAPVISPASMLQPACEQCHRPAGGCACGAPIEQAVTWELTGFFQLDAGYYNQSDRNKAALGDINDSLGFRRARLAVAGDVSPQTSYILEFDFAQGQPRFVDVWMQFANTSVGNIRIGRYRQPFGMTELTSVRDLPFLERPLAFALSPFRQTGVMFSDSAYDQRVTWAASGYRYLSDNFGNVYADAGGYGLATRLTVLPYTNGPDRLVHLGFNYSYNDPGRDMLQFVSTNEFFMGQNPVLGPGGLSVLPIVAVPPFVNSGVLPAGHTNLFNIEGAVSLGRMVLQSEARWASVQTLQGQSFTYPAAYAHVRYMLTGETIPYQRDSGVFGRVTPQFGRYGAWELAARLSYIDLNGYMPRVFGGRLTNTTLGLNWYVNNNTKFQFNWIYSALDDPAAGDGSASTLAFRGHIDF